MRILKITSISLLAAQTLAYTKEYTDSIFKDEVTEDCKCIAVDTRVDDNWCEADCMCDWCPGCGNDYCAGFCACEGPPTTPDPNAPTTTTTEATTTTKYDPSSNKTLCDSPFQYNVIYIDFGINYNDITQNIQEAVDNCYNILMVSFWVHGMWADAAGVWKFMSVAQRQAALDVAHSHGAQILLAGGGATDGIEGYVRDGKGDWYGRSLAEDAVEYMFDGVDFDVELQPGNNVPFQDGTMQQFVLDASYAAREVLNAAGKTNALITHAPQAPYLGVWTGEATMGYTGILKMEDCPIDFVNIQFYNQCPTCYTTYESLMIDGDAEGGDPSLTGQSAVAQMIANGVPTGKIVIGKPIGPSGYANNGYVTPKELHDWGCMAKYDSETFKNWNTGFMTWRYAMGNSDVGDFGLAIKQHCEQDPEFTTLPPTTIAPVDTLQEAALGLGLDIGTTMDEARIETDIQNKEEFFEIAQDNFNTITPEEACRPSSVIYGTSMNDYNFNLAECESAQVNAKARGQVMRGSWLLSFYDEDWPEFVKMETDSEILESFLVEYITYVVSNVQGTFFRDVFAWDVAIDLIVESNQGFYRESFWNVVEQVECKAFRAAREARPDVFLVYRGGFSSMSYSGVKMLRATRHGENNLQNFDMAFKSDKVFELVKLLDSADCGVDTVGLDGYMSLDWTDEDIEGVKLNMQRYADQGIRTHVTDARVICGGENDCEWNDEQLARQAELYAMLMQVCVDQYYCTSFTFNGFTDAYWDTAGDFRYGSSLFDENFEKKPAFFSVMDVLLNADRSSLVNIARNLLVEK